jgi:predicted GNAT superfamily acetyltransferase
VPAPRPVDPAAVEQAHDLAARAAATAAATAGVTLEDAHGRDVAGRASALFDLVWGRQAGAGGIVVPELLVALAHAGSQVTVARASGTVVGATAALLGLHEGEVVLHSHVTAVLPEAAGAGVGRALKLHQRAWALERGITTVRWTFDPLVRRNAVFNLVGLGARAVAYVEDLYGPMPDRRNAGLPTDRLVAHWDLTERRVQLAVEGRGVEPDVSAVRGTGAVVALDVGDAGVPVLTETDAPRRLVRIPADIEAVRASDPDLALAWGAAVREALGRPLQQGARVSGATRDGWYVLVAGAGGGATDLSG